MEARNGSGFSYFYLFFLLLFLCFTLVNTVYGNLNYINKVILSSDHKVKDEVEKVMWDN
jgi:hypothetical protein